MTSTVIALESVSFSYGRQQALQEVTGTFLAGSLTAVAGPNGAGKSTLLKMIAGIVKPKRGQIKVDPSARGKMGYLPQASGIDRDYPIHVLQAVSAGLWPQVGSVKAMGLALKASASKALDEVGLTGFENRELSSLSGGEFQRMLFARLILQDPQVILLDEPFAAVDAETISRLIQVLLAWHRQGRTIICVLHDLMLIRKYFPESFLLAGKCLGRGHTHTLFEQKLLSFDLDMAELVGPDAAPAQHEQHHHENHA